MYRYVSRANILCALGSQRAKEVESFQGLGQLMDVAHI